MTYAEKLEDPRWLTKAAEVKIRDKWKCRDCGFVSRSNDAHHTFYPANTEPWDCPEELIICVCRKCHYTRQGLEQTAHIALARLMKDWPVQRLEKAVWFWIAEELKEAGE